LSIAAPALGSRVDIVESTYVFVLNTVYHEIKLAHAISFADGSFRNERGI